MQTETDEYTRYELLSPESSSFAIRYEVTATTAGAKYFFNPIRKGSVASGESVVDVMTGESLRFEVVSGQEAVKDPLMKGEDTSEDYIKVHLARAVPPEGQVRLLILKTYKDEKSYHGEDGTIVFNRSPLQTACCVSFIRITTKAVRPPGSSYFPALFCQVDEELVGLVVSTDIESKKVLVGIANDVLLTVAVVQIAHMTIKLANHRVHDAKVGNDPGLMYLPGT